MKRTLGIAILSALILTGTAAAATEIQQQDAVFLDELGLFQGTERGYELDRTMTRAEGAVMLVRLLGGEAEAEVNVYQTPFTDVPDWAQPYVGWLYENKLTNGTSKTTYSPNESMRFEQYAWFTGRAAGFTDNDVASGKTHLSAEAYRREYGNEITRGQAVALSMDTLYAQMNGETRTLAERLIEQGVFTQESWDNVKKDFEHAKGIVQTSDGMSTSALPPCQFQTVDGVQYAIDYAPNSAVISPAPISDVPDWTFRGGRTVYRSTDDKLWTRIFQLPDNTPVRIGDVLAFDGTSLTFTVLADPGSTKYMNYVLQIEATPECATLVDLLGVTWKKEQSMRAIQAWLDENWS